MDFELSDEQQAFQETARAFAREEWLPHAAGWDARAEFPVEALRRAAALGFAGIYVGEDLPHTQPRRCSSFHHARAPERPSTTRLRPARHRHRAVGRTNPHKSP